MKKCYVVLNDSESKYGDIHIYYRKKLQARITLWADCYFLDDDYVEGFSDFRQRSWDTLYDLLNHLKLKWSFQTGSNGRMNRPDVVFDLAKFQFNQTRRESTAKNSRFLVSEPAV